MSDNTSDYAEIMTAKAWRPNPGEAITGTVANLRRQDDEYGGHVVVTLATGDGEQPIYAAVHAFHAVLKTRLFEMKPAIGDALKITYLGKVDGKNQPYHSYLVEDPAKPAEVFDWSAEPEAGF